MKWFKKTDPVLKDWQLKLLENPLVRKEEFLDKLDIKYWSKQNEFQFKSRLERYTRFSSSEMCDINLDIFENVQYVDIPNMDYLSHYLINNDGTYYLFEHKCGRASFILYEIEYNTQLFEYNESKDEYEFTGRSISDLREDVCKMIFGIRLKEQKFIHEFLENFLDRKINLKNKI